MRLAKIDLQIKYFLFPERHKKFYSPNGAGAYVMMINM